MKKVAFLICLFSPVISHADVREKDPPLPFTSGEKLVYEVRYLGVTAGEAVLSVGDPITYNGHRVYPLLSTIQSSPFVSKIYPVNNHVESYLDAEGIYSHRIDVKQHEGRRRREKRIEFDHHQHQATQTKNNQREVFPIPAQVHDFLSVLYALRARHPLTAGRLISMDVHESGKNWKLEIRTLGKETVTTPSGTYATIKVHVLSQFEGMFLSKRDLFLWITDDPLKIPVMIQSKITVGSITLVLASKQIGERGP